MDNSSKELIRQSIQQKLSTGRGKFTPDHPELGTGPVDYEDSIFEEFFADVRKAVFERSCCGVGRAHRGNKVVWQDHPQAARPMHLLYSMILVSYAVNVFKRTASRTPVPPSSTW